MKEEMAFNKLYLELCKDPTYAEFFNEMEGKDKEGFMELLHQSEIKRLKEGIDVVEYKGIWMREQLQAVSFELSMRGDEE